MDREWKFSKNDKIFEKNKNENKQDSHRILGETSSEAEKENPHVMYEVKSGEKTPDSGENLELNPASAMTSCFLTSTSEIYLSTNFEIYRQRSTVEWSPRKKKEISNINPVHYSILEPNLVQKVGFKL